MSTTGRIYDIPALGRPFRPRGTRDVTLTLDAFAPTQVDVWYATATVGGRTVRAVVVRHAGDVARRARSLLTPKQAPAPPPEPDAVLAVVVRKTGTALSWLPPGPLTAHAAELSRQVDPPEGAP